MDFIENEKKLDIYEVGKILDLGMRQVATWKKYGLIQAYKEKGKKFIYNKDEIIKVMNFVRPRLKINMTLREIANEWEKDKLRINNKSDKKVIIILIIDDTKRFLDIIKESLSSFFAEDEMKIYTEFDGDLGVKTARLIKPDVVIIDYILEGQEKTGLEISKILENDPHTKKSKIIIISGHIDIDSHDVLFISKPFKAKNLAYEISKLTGLSYNNKYS